MTDDSETLIRKIEELKARKNAVILAHYYTRPQVQDIADFVGDSLALSQQAADTEADIILFAGVRFMAETAKVLSPQKKVLMPEPDAGCSLADSCPAAEFAEFRRRYPDHTVVSYVNTSVEVKALTDICCTSSNALRIIGSLPKDRKIIFAPDRNLGRYIKHVTGREDMVLWDGACHVHEQFTAEGILELRRAHPQARVVAHPECKAPVLAMADFVGSTAAILAYCESDPGREYIVVTESGILHQMRSRCPDKVFYAVPPRDVTCGCADCEYMKAVDLKKIYRSLEEEIYEVVIEEDVRAKAEKSIRAMLEY